MFNNSGESDYSYVKQALEWVNANVDRYRIASVLMALGDNQGHVATDDQYQLGQTLAELANRGIIPVAAAGNDFARLNGQFGLSSPANDLNVVAVGAVYNGNLGRQEYSNHTVAFSSGIDRLTPFSQRASRTLFAPGAAITGAGATESSLLTLQGSSQSAAYVAGAADFLAGQSTAQINVIAIDDLLVESGETVKISLAAGNGYQLTKKYQAGLAIVDNDSILSSSLALNQSPPVILLPSIPSRRDSESIDNLVNFLSSPIIPKALTHVVTTTTSPIESIISDASRASELKLVLQPTETLKITIALAANYLIQDIDFATDWLPTGLLGIQNISTLDPKKLYPS